MEKAFGRVHWWVFDICPFRDRRALDTSPVQTGRLWIPVQFRQVGFISRSSSDRWALDTCPVQTGGLWIPVQFRQSSDAGLDIVKPSHILNRLLIFGPIKPLSQP